MKKNGKTPGEEASAIVHRRARELSSSDALDPYWRLNPPRPGARAPVGVAQCAASAVAPRVDLAQSTERKTVTVATGDADDALVLHRRHQRGRDENSGSAGIRSPAVPQERLADFPL